MSCRAAIVILTVLLAVSQTPGSGRAAEDVSVGAGDRTGPYYKFGRGICRLLSRSVEDMTCAVLPTPRGDTAESYSNLVNVRNGAADIGLVRSDWLYFGVTGSGPLAHVFERLDTIRSLFSLHSRPVTLVARRDAGITGLDDLAGKRVNIGRAYSDDRNSVELVLAAKNWTAEDFILAEQLPRSEQTLAFCHNRIQAMFFTVSYPDDAVRHATEICDAELVNLDGGAIDEILSAKPYLSQTAIPRSTYPGMADDVTTFGANVTVVTSADVPEELAYAIVKAVFENLPDLQKMHPALQELEPGRMVRDGLTAPYHIGAMRYYREQGLH